MKTLAIERIEKSLKSSKDLSRVLRYYSILATGVAVGQSFIFTIKSFIGNDFNHLIPFVVVFDGL